MKLRHPYSCLCPYACLNLVQVLTPPTEMRATKRSYCILSHTPFFELHFEVSSQIRNLTSKLSLVPM